MFAVTVEDETLLIPMGIVRTTLLQHKMEINKSWHLVYRVKNIASK